MNQITPISFLGKRDRDPATPEHPQKKQKISELNFFDYMPLEIQLEIAKYLSPSQFRDLQLTCKKFASLKEGYFKWVASEWCIKDKNSEERDSKIQTFYKKIIDASKVATGNKPYPITQVNFASSVPVMIRSYQEQIDRDTLIVANKISEAINEALALGICPNFTKAEEARKWLNDPKIENQLEEVLILELDKLDLHYLPPEITKLTKLERLYLSDNNFTAFPEVILELSPLKGITIDVEKFEALPENVVKFFLKLAYA
ncbi:MAG: hypothetical protein K1000chlam3_01375 [Chlamydiae bacterium]|nr:hypothetical protein [Chlamydiota bacterium]